LLKIQLKSKKKTYNKVEKIMRKCVCAYASRDRRSRDIKRKVFSLFILVILFSFTSSWGSGFAVSGIGLKAMGMGGAFRGLADDWSASFWNPAGLATMENSELYASLFIFSPRPSYQPEITFEGYDVGFKNGIKWYPDDKNIGLPNFGGFIKIGKWGGFNTGMSFFIPYTAKYGWDIYHPPPGYETGTPYPKANHQINLDVFDFHPCVAKELIKDKLSAGLGISVQFANFLFRKTILVPTDSILQIYRPYENFPMDAKLDEDGWGFGFNLGLLYKLTPKLQLGISYRSPIDLNLSGTTTLDIYSPYNPWVGWELERKNRHGAYEIFLGDVYSQEFDEEIDLSLPGDLGAGVAFKPNEKITLTFDVNRVNWSRLEKINPRFSVDQLTVENDTLVPLEENLESAKESEILFNWEDVTRISFGFEYLPLENLPVYGGYYFDPSPIPDNTLSPILPEIGDKSCITFGIGYKFGNTEIGYNYEYQSYKKRTVQNLSDLNEDGIFDNYPGEYWMEAHISHFTISYRF